MQLTTILHKRVAAVAPIFGVGLGEDLSKKEGWTIDFRPEATAEQRLAAQAVVDAFDFDKEKAREDVPAEVWAGAMMRALSALDIQDQIEAIVAASNDWLLKKLWNRATAFKRDDPMIAAIGAQAGWSESDLDDLFRLAGSFNS